LKKNNWKWRKLVKPRDKVFAKEKIQVKKKRFTVSFVEGHTSQRRHSPPSQRVSSPTAKSTWSWDKKKTIENRIKGKRKKERTKALNRGDEGTRA